MVSSTIIQEIEVMRKSGLASLAFYYHDFREGQKRDLRGLLTSVLFQLCDQSDSYHDMLSIFYSTHRYGAQNPSNGELLRYVKELLELPGQAPVFLIIDALDECPDTSAMPSPREEVLTLVEQLIDSRLRNLRLCVTSRLEIDIKLIFEPLAFRSVSIHDERGQLEDIENYIRSVVNSDPKNRRWKQQDKQLVIDVLTERANGMYVIKIWFVDDFAQTNNIGSVGFTVSLYIFVAVTQDGSVMPWLNCQVRLMRRMNARWERSRKQIGNLPIDCFSASPSLLGHLVSRNWRSFSHSIST
jgi:hypothetical protein